MNNPNDQELGLGGNKSLLSKISQDVKLSLFTIQADMAEGKTPYVWDNECYT